MKAIIPLSTLTLTALAFAGSAYACGEYDDSSAHVTPPAMLGMAPPAASKVPASLPAPKVATAKKTTTARKPVQVTCSGGSCDAKQETTRPLVLGSR